MAKETKKGPLEFMPVADPTLLSADEIAQIELEAEQEVRAKAKDEAKAALKAKLVAKNRQTVGLDEPVEAVFIDLPLYCKQVLIDNVAYLQGVTYTVRASVAIGLREVIQRTWGHQSIIDGKSENYYRKQKAPAMSMATGAVTTTSNLLRA